MYHLIIFIQLLIFAPCDQFEVKLVPLNSNLCECFNAPASTLTVWKGWTNASQPFSIDPDGNFVSSYVSTLLDPPLSVGFDIYVKNTQPCLALRCHQFNVYHRKTGTLSWNLQGQTLCVRSMSQGTHIKQWATLTDSGQGGCNFTPDPTYLWNPINRQPPFNLEECGDPQPCYDRVEADCQ